MRRQTRADRAEVVRIGIEAGRVQAPEGWVPVEGRSYRVEAPTADLARPVARRKAQRAGQSNWATAQALWVERTGEYVRGIPVYEVVLEAPTPTPAHGLARHVRRADRVQTP